MSDDAKSVLWTAHAAPSVIVLTDVPDGIADPRYRQRFPLFNSLPRGFDPECLLPYGEMLLRLAVDPSEADPLAVLLPLDKLFQTRLGAVEQLWRALNNRKLKPDPARLTRQHRDRLVTVLRALDARLQHVSYQHIARTLFRLKPMPDAEWQTHELRSHTVRLCQTGRQLMNGGYRNLLLYPYRRLP